ncbi:MAG: Gfo/Idh/MocA family oxidoreductase [Thermotogae bacterium]|nr:Gfo/Idh/MocA family oxidoreductase [Thermotogota bacterium]
MCEKTIKVVVLGAGSRGYDAYGNLIHRYPDKVKIVGVAEPNPIRREKISKAHNIPVENQFESWEQLLSKEKFADLAIISMMDKMHVEPAILAMEKGYHLLLEKPMATDIKGCLKIIEAEERTKKRIFVAYVLRYTKFFRKLRELINSGKIGDLIGIEHKENIGFFHFAHSFVRGNWRNSVETAPSILTKSCHDMDILYWLVGSKPRRLSSFGELVFFKPANQPQGAADRCLDCPIESDCPYSAVKIYTIPNYKGWPVNTIVDEVTPENVYQALKVGPYGRCVFKCDNDVVDYQITNIEFENGVKVSFTMSAFTNEINRTIKVFGSHGEIVGDFEKGTLEVKRFAFDRETYDVKLWDQYGHGGGDEELIKYIISVLRYSREDPKISTSARESLESHLMAFAAEESRLNNGKVIDMKEFKERNGVYFD